jgi:hypothetical protein
MIKSPTNNYKSGRKSKNGASLKIRRGIHIIEWIAEGEERKKGIQEAHLIMGAY